jgi:hypothetical protein
MDTGSYSIKGGGSFEGSIEKFTLGKKEEDAITYTVVSKITTDKGVYDVEYEAGGGVSLKLEGGVGKEPEIETGDSAADELINSLEFSAEAINTEIQEMDLNKPPGN